MKIRFQDKILTMKALLPKNVQRSRRPTEFRGMCRRGRRRPPAYPRLTQNGEAKFKMEACLKLIGAGIPAYPKRGQGLATSLKF